MIEKEKGKKTKVVYYTKVDIIPKYKKKWFIKSWPVREEEFEERNLLYDAKCCDAIVKVVGHSFLRKKEYCEATGMLRWES